MAQLSVVPLGIPFLIIITQDLIVVGSLSLWSIALMATFSKNRHVRDSLENIINDQFHLIEESSAWCIRGPSIEDLMKVLADNDLSPLMIRPCNLEDVFLILTGRELTGNA